jgi:hypothetical protein
MQDNSAKPRNFNPMLVPAGFDVLWLPGDYARWLGDEPDPRELMRPFRADLMRMWPISMRVNKWPVSSHCRPLRVLCCFESTGMKIPRTETGIRRNPFVL